MADRDGQRGGGSRRRDLPLVADRMVGLERQIASTHPSVAAGWDLPVDLDEDPAVIPQLADVEVPEDLKREIEWRMSLYPDPRSAVLPALKAAQRVHGCLSDEAMRQVAAVMKVTPAYLSSIASFYDMLHEQPVGRNYLYVCTGVACHVRDPQRVFHAMEEAARTLGLDDWEVREFECLGACDMAPMASVNGRYIGPLEPGDAPEVVLAARDGRTPLPGRGLEDPDFRLPYPGPGERGDMQPQEQAPTEQAERGRASEEHRRSTFEGEHPAQADEEDE
jgi:NADH-quinone oxidoreductase subunit E